MVGRIPVLDVMPQLAGGAYPAKAAVGEPFEVTATVIREGHDALSAEVVLVAPDGSRRPPVRMERDPAHAPDGWRATVTLDEEGAWGFEVQGWSDPFGTWEHNAEIKIAAGIDTELMFTEGQVLLQRWIDEQGAADPASAKVLQDAITGLSDSGRPDAVRLGAGLSPSVHEVLSKQPLRDLVTVEGPFPVFADRPLALFSAWYEFFPRSEGATQDPQTGKVVSGTFRTAAERLPAVADMGFDIIYLPPIHPIGKVNRKGRNNTLTPGPDDVGSPWAIGSDEGGHDAIHPDLGTFDDFDFFVARAKEVGLEVALDFALQAAPDHPWATEHPEFFTTRVDGTIAYAENPPKKYQDIYPINFDNDTEGIYAETLRVLRVWMDRGVRVFRVDNPHTKPVAFWEWLLGQVRKTDPDVIFLSEAFTKPAMMRALAMVGFHQSYTYFTWRNARWEIEEYFREVSQETAHVLRPSFWVNTPDILPGYLQDGGRPAFKVRAVLAALGSPSWGMYAGYELCENVALRPGAEEYLDSEKFQIRIRDWKAAEAEGRTLAPYITRLNEIRKAHPALHELRNLRVHGSDDGSVIAFSKSTVTDGVRDTVIAVVNVDPHQTHETTVHLDLPSLGMDWQDRFVVHDEVTGEDWTWGEHNYVRLDPFHEPAHILTVRSASA
ncbi:alpha-1,4-glucan--maltose-1-phosphate maltosyltransferase [Nocardioides marmoribigeumensis]|uniref:Alpha-1,4-glucan:maltose-1-phosphate maltosyltransferase n=1 Tax=Nocardioides marmoribigeumensis TaxID=433649 RepID=A0ABU2BZ34_9ACTN|nr:alpha-1,4-glucan--maltose-1-phosphate maltosyltransferase [Nocardioides marmoribigeumensis]MDR7363665.1 starch synthase (maltosyl-transferring) [Nocardioides marmoribigeumensis]